MDSFTIRINLNLLPSLTLAYCSCECRLDDVMLMDIFLSLTGINCTSDRVEVTDAGDLRQMSRGGNVSHRRTTNGGLGACSTYVPRTSGEVFTPRFAMSGIPS